MYKKSAVELLQLIKKRELGIEELTRMYLERIEKIDRGEGGLNSVGEIIDHALAKAREMDSQKDRSAPLFGLPILIKDNIDVAGLHTTSGSLALADNRAERDADIVSNLRRRGAFIFGKTHMTEFANYMAENMPGGYSSLGGQVIHAYDAKINPGGSSSGSGVAVSAGLCAAAIGTDTSFSIVGCAVIN
jgi:amidase